MPMVWIGLTFICIIFCIYYNIKVAPLGTLVYFSQGLISRKGGIPIVGIPPVNYESKGFFLICGSDANYDTPIVE